MIMTELSFFVSFKFGLAVLVNEFEMILKSVVFEEFETVTSRSELVST
jgi:hypothetical protein